MLDQNIIKKNFISALISSIIPIVTIYSYCVFVGLYCIDDNRLTSAIDIILFLVYHLILLYTMVFYMRVLSNDDVSTINKFPHLQTEKLESNLEDLNPFVEQEILQKKMKSIKTCPICNTYKPPRSHHCSFCNKCYLKMDHHCFPLGTCIAFHNYKFFYNFLILNGALSVFTIVTLMIRILGPREWSRFKTNYTITVSFHFIEFIIICYFLYYHTKLISLNETTIENIVLDEILGGLNRGRAIFQEGPIATFSESKDRTVLNPYNLGKKENWMQVFGRDKKQWLLPSFSSLGDGINFPKNYREDDTFDV